MTKKPRRKAVEMNKPFQICLFEDDVAAALTPYQLGRPCYTIPNGFYNLIDRIQMYEPNVPLSLICKPNHEIFLRKRCPKISINILNKSLPTLYINARCNFSSNYLKSIVGKINPEKNYLYIKEQAVVAIYCSDQLNESVFHHLLTTPSFDAIVKKTREHCIVEEKKLIQLVNNWWDYLDQLNSNLVMDFNAFTKKSLLEGDISSFSSLTNDRNMYIDHLSKVSEYVSLDASNGPIIIMDHVTIKPFVRIEGPCFIGSHTIINSNADIASSYIGNNCKIGGEVKRCIVQQYTNKSHAGFIGDSVIGEWVNIGAQSTTSNLKLSYGPISSYDLYSKEIKNTGLQFLGCIFGDYVRTGIQSLFECGSVISSASSLYGSDPHAKFIPPFTWGKTNDYKHQNITSFIEALGRMMSRRNIYMSEEEQMVFKTLFEEISLSSDPSLKTVKNLKLTD